MRVVRLSVIGMIGTWKIRFNEIEKLVKLCEEIDQRAELSSITSTRVYYSMCFFKKGIRHIRSITHLLNGVENNYQNIDVAGMCAIGRCVIEVFSGYSYLTKRGITSEELEMRFLIYELNSSVDFEKIYTGLGLPVSEYENGLLPQLQGMTEAELEKNIAFKRFGEKEKKHLLRGKTPYIVPKSNDKRPLPKEQESAVYNLFSHCVHSYALGVGVQATGKQNITNSTNLIFLAIEIALLYQSQLLLDYWRLRSRAIKKMTLHEKAFLLSCSSLENYEMWRTEMNKLQKVN